MKIAFVGKGGSGKTTLASLMAAHLASQGHPTLAIDADINQHLATALGATETEAQQIPPLSHHMDLIKDHLRGDNPRIPSGDAMIKTTPPGTGSRLIQVEEANPIYAMCVREVAGVRVAVTGPLSDGDVGVACYHGKLGGAELLLTHLIDGPGEYVVVDMTAGADSVASGLFARFDLVVVACEPTLRSVAVHHQVAPPVKELGVPIVAVGNKVLDDADQAFLHEHLGGDLLTSLCRSDHVRAAERGDHRPVDHLEAGNRTALDTIQRTADALDKDWAAYQRRTVDLHLLNARAWGNDRVGQDLSQQVDPSFIPGPAPSGTEVGAGSLTATSA